VDKVVLDSNFFEEVGRPAVRRDEVRKTPFKSNIPSCWADANFRPRICPIFPRRTLT